jgi:hypothetical protein
MRGAAKETDVRRTFISDISGSTAGVMEEVVTIEETAGREVLDVLELMESTDKDLFRVSEL